MGWARTEKNALVDTLRRADPDAPTLCAGWSTRRLLAHLVQREQDLTGTVGDGIGHAEPGHEKYLGRLADGAGTPEGYAALVDRFVAGPPRWSPFRWAADQVNLLEYVIHHEDVRRGATGAPGGSGSTVPEPRTLPPAQDRAVWRQLPLVSRLRYRRSPVPVALALPSGAQTTVAKGPKPAAGSTPATPAPVVLTGSPTELALYTSGRRAAAHVQVSGPPASVEAFQTWVDQQG